MSYTTTNVHELVKIREFDEQVVPETIIDVLHAICKQYGHRDAMVYNDNGFWKRYTWRRYYDTALQIAAVFIKFGLQVGEGVSIMGFNSPEWFLCNLAAIMAGGVSVGIYTTNSVEICEYIIKDSNSQIVVVENELQLKKILSINGADRIKAIIQYTGSLNDSLMCYHNVYDWSTIMMYATEMCCIESSERTCVEQVNDMIGSLKPNQCSTIIYTSGTTGMPKGVMLSHDNVIWTAKAVLKQFNIKQGNPQRVVSYLPLSHVAGQMVDIYGMMVNGGSTWFAEPTALKGTLVKTLLEAKPTIFLGVPRVWEKIQDQINASIKGKLKRFIMDKAMKVGLKYHQRLECNYHKKPDHWKLYDKLVFSKIKEKMGLSCCKLFLSGAAPIKMDTLQFFASIGIHIDNIYGMSECSGPMSISTPMMFKTGSCGRRLMSTDLIIIPGTGEICTAGRHIMMGYLNNPEKTAETIDDEGWLHSGDIGKIDNNGYLYVTDRIKNLIITSGGENIAPTPIEDRLRNEIPIISNCMVIGDKRKFLSVLVTLKCVIDENGNPTNELDPSAIAYIQSLGSSVNTVSGARHDFKVTNCIEQGLIKSNVKSTSNAHNVYKFTILPTDFSINGGELGPTLKIKRMVVEQKYHDLIEKMYTGEQA